MEEITLYAGDVVVIDDISVTIKNAVTIAVPEGTYRQVVDSTETSPRTVVLVMGSK